MLRKENILQPPENSDFEY